MKKTRQSTNQLTRLQEKRLDCLLEEYRALYGLALYRLTSLDRRAPIAGAALTATLVGIPAVPQPATIVVFLGLPLVLVWFLRTTINHARSFEDALRRIEQIEGDVNRLLGAETILFQTQHPSKGHATGGRTGRETIGAAQAIAATLLIGCVWMFKMTLSTTWQGMMAYSGFIFMVLSYLQLRVLGLRAYEYQPQLPKPGDTQA